MSKKTKRNPRCNVGIDPSKRWTVDYGYGGTSRKCLNQGKIKHKRKWYCGIHIKTVRKSR